MLHVLFQHVLGTGVLRRALASRTLSALAWLSFLGCEAAPGAAGIQAATSPIQQTTAPGPALASSQRVLDITRRFTTRLVTITTSDGTVVTTPEHPFAKRGSGWTPAIQLAAGDLLERRDSEGATILSVQVRDVPPAPVYNLTVAKTHSYFVSSQDLLVHNTNCGKRRRTLRELLDREKWAERRDPVLNDTRGTRNCGLCTLAGLSDADKLSVFLMDHKDNDKLWDSHEEGMYDEDIPRHLGELGLVSSKTPEPGLFPPDEQLQAMKDAAENSRKTNFPWPDVLEFMQSSTSNTFFINTEFFNSSGPAGHAVLAVRDVDGSIKFVDFQKVPPAVVDPTKLDPNKVRTYKVDVTPTDIDWRYNRQIYRVISGSK